jgi:mRNA interferase RelE/StbE
VTVEYSRDALRFLDAQPKKTVARIRKAIAKLTLNPPEGDIAQMRGYSDGRKRLRVGSWRIIFRYTTENRMEILLIIDIGNRGDIYK